MDQQLKSDIERLLHRILKVIGPDIRPADKDEMLVRCDSALREAAGIEGVLPEWKEEL